MLCFVCFFEVVVDMLNVYYQVVVDVNFDVLLVLWIDEDFVSCVWVDGEYLYGFDQICGGFVNWFVMCLVMIELFDICVYDSFGMVVYMIVEVYQQVDLMVEFDMVFVMYVMIYECGEWCIVYIYVSLIFEQVVG